MAEEGFASKFNLNGEWSEGRHIERRFYIGVLWCVELGNGAWINKYLRKWDSSSNLKMRENPNCNNGLNWTQVSILGSQSLIVLKSRPDILWARMDILRLIRSTFSKEKISYIKN